jgi:nucleoside-diphosphate-sugar epimerase
MRSALVTGVTGFIGGKLAERLHQNGWTVHALVRCAQAEANEGVRFHHYDGSLASLSAILGETRPDVVFHLASLYLADHRPDQIEDLVASNILMPVQLAEAMTAAGCLRLINAGTAWQHFESASYRPVNLYAATKQACMDLLHYYHDARNLSVITLKLFDTFGAGDKRRKLVQLLVDAALSGERLEMSPGEQVIDLTHVDDVVSAFVVASDRLLAAGEPLKEDFLISGERLRVRELVTAVEAALGASLDVRFAGRPYRPREVMLPIAARDCDVLPDWRRNRSVMGSLKELNPHAPISSVQDAC